MADNNYNIKIFKLHRIKFEELWSDAMTYIKQTYKSVQQVFTPASPFGQLLQVILHLGRMIFYYIEDSITGLNIRTAYRPDQIRGLAQLTGHTACRPIASRGAIRITYYGNKDSENIGGVCYIPNKTKITSRINGSTYTILFGADNAKITMQSGNYVDATIIAGQIKAQSATATGKPLQSYNFTERNYANPDEYFINVYVNNEPWDVVSSLIDLGYQQKGCVLRTGISGGVDIFFGNGAMGAIPQSGATILVEYAISDGGNTNINKDYANSDNFWEFQDEGYLMDGTPLNLNNNFEIKLLTDIIFGSSAEDIQLTQLLAPHTSRSYVLASEINYKYFFKRMNLFKKIEITQGTSNRTGLTVLNYAYQQASTQYQTMEDEYQKALKLYAEGSQELVMAKDMRDYAERMLNYTEQRLADSIYVDNTVYIYLVPDIKKRIPTSQNYFTCNKSSFQLSETECNNLLKMIDMSGQRIITVENKIVQPKQVFFAINVQAKIYDNFTYQDVYASGLNALSEYLINLDNRDTIPVSDIVSIFENQVNGIDSVKVEFVAAKDNAKVYMADVEGTDEFYGIDLNYGDIILTRTTYDATGSPIEIHDMTPVFRGGWIGTDNQNYQETQTSDVNLNCAFNLYIKEHVKNKKLSLDTTVID